MSASGESGEHDSASASKPRRAEDGKTYGSFSSATALVTETSLSPDTSASPGQALRGTAGPAFQRGLPAEHIRQTIIITRRLILPRHLASLSRLPAARSQVSPAPLGINGDPPGQPRHPHRDRT
jgi:hypothetical protein